MKIGAFVGLGANLEDPRSQLLRAFEELAQLPQSTLIARSSLWHSTPQGFAQQPAFVNAVAGLETGLASGALLDALQDIELAHARTRSFANAPRTLDLDLLLYGDEVGATPRLTLPHPRMHERAFVLAPLLEIAPQVVIPGLGPAVSFLAGVRGQVCTRID